RELGIDVRAQDVRAPEAADEARSAEPAAASGGQLTGNDVLRALSIKGSATVEQLAEGLASPRATVQPLLDALVADGTAEKASGQVRPSARAKLEAADLFVADRSALGEPECVRLLEEFHALDRRMKQVVTAWQVRDVGGEQTINDHTDADYDARVLADLAALDADTAEWLAPLVDRLPRFGVYRSRLARARDLAAGGDQRYVASPRVDSYHSVWFELHEDLIRLAGRKREE
ncbi:MAG: hypothetical protein M3N29_00060, partial [Chloroflexota bacterium]|nr:hypothetical protein [Chloroflexota bacterium]